MATAAVDWTTTVNGAAVPGNFMQPMAGVGNAPVVRSRFIDCTVTPLTGTSYKLFTLAPGDVVTRCIVIPTASEATVTIAVGDATTANSMRTAAVITDGTITVSAAPVQYAAANEIQMTASAAFSAAKFWVIIEVIPGITG